MLNSDRRLPTGLHAETIDEVILSLNKIVDWSKDNSKRTGYFAALYRKVTIKVKQGIESGYFEDGKRMERLDVIFANRYLDAFEQYHAGRPVTDVWNFTFDLTKKRSPVVLEHLMIGMNAHINLDLGIAAAQTVASEELPLLESDFNKINEVLSDLVDEVENELAQIWPVFKLLDKVAGNIDERLADAGMEFAREKAWELALQYGAASDKERVIEKMDKKMTMIAHLFMNPGLFVRIILLLVRLGERGDVAKKITILE